MDALFDGRMSKSTTSYLRLTVHRLREILPDCIVSDDDKIRLKDDAPIMSDSMAFETRIIEAARMQGEQRHG